MSDLLKEAIADAKTVRETAIANAKMALEEAFTPHLKSMLSAKLAEDDMEDDEDEKENPFDGEETYGDEDEMRHDNDEMRHDNEEEMEPEMDDEDEPEMEEEGVIEINGVKYAPVMSEEDDEMEDEEEMKEDQELDLESVIKELETEIKEADEDEDEDKVDEAKDDEDEKVDEDIVTEEDEEDEDKDKTDEQSTSSGIGKGTGVKMASPSDEEDPGKGKDKPHSKNESVELKAELKEYKEAVTFLREKLHEVNILNAKLLYTNRLFKEYVLSNDQKMKIVETFDRAQTAREIKLVYSTLAESFKGGSVKKTRVQESASVKSGTTKPTKKIITEESEVASRFKKLAGII